MYAFIFLVQSPAVVILFFCLLFAFEKKIIIFLIHQISGSRRLAGV